MCISTSDPRCAPFGTCRRSWTLSLDSENRLGTVLGGSRTWARSAAWTLRLPERNRHIPTRSGTPHCGCRHRFERDVRSFAPSGASRCWDRAHRRFPLFRTASQDKNSRLDVDSFALGHSPWHPSVASPKPLTGRFDGSLLPSPLAVGDSRTDSFIPGATSRSLADARAVPVSGFTLHPCGQFEPCPELTRFQPPARTCLTLLRAHPYLYTSSLSCASCLVRLVLHWLASFVLRYDVVRRDHRRYPYRDIANPGRWFPCRRLISPHWCRLPSNCPNGVPRRIHITPYAQRPPTALNSQLISFRSDICQIPPSTVSLYLPTASI